MPAPESSCLKQGRYAVIGSGEARLLYIPEVQELFDAPPVLLDFLERADVEAPALVELRGDAARGQALRPNG